MRVTGSLVSTHGYFAAHSGAASARRSRVRLDDCRLESAVARRQRGGALRLVSRAREPRRPKGKELQLHVAVIPALRLKPAADPLFILSGGPGQAASDFYLRVAPAFARIRRDRDIVMVDQRGTGRSNRLDCAFPDDCDFTVLDPQKLQAAVRACLASLPGDPRYYTTSVAVRDLDDVRAALGYAADQSLRRLVRHARRAALHAPLSRTRAHGDPRRRVPAEVALGPDVAIEAQRAIDSAFAALRADADCARAFPDIPAQFAALQARLRKRAGHAVDSGSAHAASPRARSSAPHALGAAVRLLSYADETVSTLPLLIHEAQSLRRAAGAGGAVPADQAHLEEQFAYGMHFAVVCSEDAPRWDQENVTERALAKTYMGTAFMSGMRTVCAQWPRGPVDRGFRQAAAERRADAGPVRQQRSGDARSATASRSAGTQPRRSTWCSPARVTGSSRPAACRG